MADRYIRILDEVMKDAAGGSVRRRRLDMTDPLHRECVMEMLGGEDFLKTELPGLHESVMRGRVPEPDGDTGLLNGVGVCNVVAGEGFVGAFGDFDLLETDGTPPPKAYGCISLYEGDRLLSRDFAFYHDENRGEVETVKDLSTDSRTLRAVLQVAWDDGSNGIQSEVVEADAMEVVDSPVTGVTVKHPLRTNKTTPEEITTEYVESDGGTQETGKTFVNVCYDRDPFKGEFTNYRYCGFRIGNKRQELYLDVRGEFTLEERCRYLGFTDVEMLLSLRNGASFSRSKVTEKHFVTEDDGRKVKFGFPTYWNNYIPSTSMAGRELTDLDVQIGFEFEDSRYGEKVTRRATVKLSSVVPDDDRLTDSPDFAKLDRIKLNWGCVAAGSVVLMADGSERRVEDLRVGDMVSDGTSAHRVEHIRGGADDVTVMITAGDRVLRVSPEHPVLTARGMVMACDVGAEDVLVTRDGEVSPDSAFQFLGRTDVYGISLEDGHRFVCNGFVIGDDHAQGEVMEGERRKREPSAEILREIGILRRHLY